MPRAAPSCLDFSDRQPRLALSVIELFVEVAVLGACLRAGGSVLCVLRAVCAACWRALVTHVLAVAVCSMKPHTHARGQESEGTEFNHQATGPALEHTSVRIASA